MFKSWFWLDGWTCVLSTKLISWMRAGLTVWAFVCISATQTHCIWRVLFIELLSSAQIKQSRRQKESCHDKHRGHSNNDNAHCVARYHLIWNIKSQHVSLFFSRSFINIKVKQSKFQNNTTTCSFTYKLFIDENQIKLLYSSKEISEDIREEVVVVVLLFWVIQLLYMYNVRWSFAIYLKIFRKVHWSLAIQCHLLRNRCFFPKSMLDIN